ncbi:MAG TPA: tetratricopeptide repeat protein [Pyrinomonadaceae bacterium]
MDWVRPLLMMFYAPGRAMREVRERAPLAAAMLLALLAEVAYASSTQWQFLRPVLFSRGPSIIFAILFQSVVPLLFIAVIFVPALAFIANLFERRASFGLIIQQEYAALTAAIFYAWAAANLIAIPLSLMARASGVEAGFITELRQYLSTAAQQGSISPEMAVTLAGPLIQSVYFAVLLLMPLFAFWALMAVREVFKLSGLRAAVVTLSSGILMFIVAPILMPIFGTVLGSPFLLLLFFFLLRGYFGELARTQRARASFKQNLEAATLNPADASAHYNLGLIHQQRGELAEARRRFERAVEIDAEEIDSHYQLGRISRTEGKLPAAIGHFEQVVAHDEAHSQHEIWREIGATYLAAGQFEDARAALERFLEHRTSDPEGLYLMGRALAGLGRTREAAGLMQACIEAVKTAPAYKYRTEKRWLNEAQQFLRSQA